MANWFSSFLHPEEGYKKAEAPVNAAFNEARGYLTPYYQQGEAQYNPLMGAESALLHPQQLENEWASSYETSPYAKQMLGLNQQQGLDAASSMGLLSSSGALENIQKGAANITAADRRQFLEDLMQKFLSGIGIGQSIYGTGATMGTNLGELATRRGENLAGLEYGRANAPGNLFENILKTGAGLGAQFYKPRSPALAS